MRNPKESRIPQRLPERRPRCRRFPFKARQQPPKTEKTNEEENENKSLPKKGNSPRTVLGEKREPGVTQEKRQASCARLKSMKWGSRVRSGKGKREFDDFRGESRRRWGQEKKNKTIQGGGG